MGFQDDAAAEGDAAGGEPAGGDEAEGKEVPSTPAGTTAGAGFLNGSSYYMISGIGTIIWIAYIMPLIARVINSISGRC